MRTAYQDQSVWRPGKTASGMELTLFFLAVAMASIYTRPSGGFQLADIVILIAAANAVYGLSGFELASLKPLLAPAYVFVMWVAGRNLAAYVADAQNTYIMRTLQFAYGFLVFFVFVILTRRILNRSRGGTELMIGAAVVMGVPLMGLLGVGGSERGPGLERATLTFNDPNQLAYFTILVMAAALAGLRKASASRGATAGGLRWARLLTVGIVAVGNMYVLWSASIAGLFGALLVDVLLVLFLWARLKSYWRALAVILLMVVTVGAAARIGMAWDATVLSRRLERRNFVEDLERRWFERSGTLSSTIVLVGHPRPTTDLSRGRGSTSAGQGNEVHNSALQVLFNYGVVGGVLLAVFFFRWAKLSLESIWSVCFALPVVLMNFAIYGLRPRLFWILLALMFALSDKSGGAPRSIDVA